MNKLSKSVLLLLVLALAAWTVAQAEVVTNIKQPIAPASAFVPCANGGAGEIVEFSGDLHVLITSTVNDNNVSGKYHYQPQGVEGIGQITGDRYRATGVTQETFKGSLQNGQYTATFVNNFRIIGPGPGNNFLVHQLGHVTVNANGEVTVLLDNASVECK